MPTLYWIAVTLHVLAALFWLGGMFFLGVVGAPVLREVEPRLRQQLFALLGRRFRSTGWGAIAVLLVTGPVTFHYRGLLAWDGVLGTSAFWGTAMGTAVAAKLAAVLTMIVVSLVHDFLLGPAASRMPPGSPEALRLRVRAAWLARANAFVGVLVVIAAVRLARGG